MEQLLSKEKPGFEKAEIKAIRFTSPILAGPDRMGPPKEEKILFTERDLAWIQFEEKLGIYDFTKDQHRSWIRSNHLSVRGVKGEIFDSQLSLLSNFATPLPLELKRINRGEGENQEGYYLEGIIAGESWVYRNPFAPARLKMMKLPLLPACKRWLSMSPGVQAFMVCPKRPRIAISGSYLGGHRNRQERESKPAAVGQSFLT